MRPLSILLCWTLSALVAAQSAQLDHGRLDPAWFGPSLTFEKSTRVYYLWVRPGLSLQGRSLRVDPWEPPVWLVKPRPEADQAFLRLLEPIFQPTLAAGLSAELEAALPLSATGDVRLTGRVTDCRAADVGGMFGGVAGIYFDLKLVDARSGELLVGAHHFIEGETAESIQSRYQKWCRTLAQVLAERTLPPLKPKAVAPLSPVSPAPPAPAPQPPGPTTELEAALRRLEALRRDGLLTEEEFQILRKQAVGKAAAPK